MISPTQSDPQRALKLAIQSLRLLGIVSTLFGIVIIVRFGYFNRSVLYRPHFIAMGMIAWFVPGMFYLACAAFLKSRLLWAAPAAMVVTSLQLLIALAAFVANFMLTPISPIPVIICFLWVIALAQLLAHLRQSQNAVRSDAEVVRGFELIITGSPTEISNEAAPDRR